MYIKVAKIRDDAYLPERANPSDAGMDIRTPEDIVVESLKYHPGGFNSHSAQMLSGKNNFIIPTGLKIEIPHGYMLEIKNKSSIGSKGIIIGACIIDSGYKGELKVNLINVGKFDIRFKKGDKIAQAVLTPIISCGIIEADEEELYKEINVNSDRGDGGFGSTGR